MHTPAAADQFHYTAAFTHRLYVKGNTSSLPHTHTHMFCHTLLNALINSDRITGSSALMHL